MSTVMVTVSSTRPRPEQVVHGVAIVSPQPRHVEHSDTVIIEPRNVFLLTRTCPAPPHVEQRVGLEPGAAPEPEQVEQATAVR
jgi:hypothetical protein